MKNYVWFAGYIGDKPGGKAMKWEWTKLYKRPDNKYNKTS